MDAHENLYDLPENEKRKVKPESFGESFVNFWMKTGILPILLALFVITYITLAVCSLMAGEWDSELYVCGVGYLMAILGIFSVGFYVRTLAHDTTYGFWKKLIILLVAVALIWIGYQIAHP